MYNEKFTLNEKNNELKMSISTEEVILETNKSKIEIKGNFKLIKCLRNFHKINLRYNLRKSTYHAIKYMISELILDDRNLEIHWIIKKDSYEIDVLKDLKLM